MSFALSVEDLKMAYIWYFNLGTYVVLIVGCAIAWEIVIKITLKNRNRAHWFRSLMNAVFWIYVDKTLSFIIPEFFPHSDKLSLFVSWAGTTLPGTELAHQKSQNSNCLSNISLNASTVPRITVPTENNTCFLIQYHRQWEVLHWIFE